MIGILYVIMYRFGNNTLFLLYIISFTSEKHIIWFDNISLFYIIFGFYYNGAISREKNVKYNVLNTKRCDKVLYSL